MKLLRQIVEPRLETLLASKGIEHGMWASALQPSRESDQGDLTLPCFACIFRASVIWISPFLSGLIFLRILKISGVSI